MRKISISFVKFQLELPVSPTSSCLRCIWYHPTGRGSFTSYPSSECISVTDPIEFPVIFPVIFRKVLKKRQFPFNNCMVYLLSYVMSRLQTVSWPPMLPITLNWDNTIDFSQWNPSQPRIHIHAQVPEIWEIQNFFRAKSRTHGLIL